jgi:hypothetical protein
LLSVAAMVAAIVWALQAWLPAPWALLGGILVLCRIGLFTYWMNSYWGGAVSALGGALVIGALGRIMKTWRPADAVILGVGEAILANSRPFEGLIFSLPVFALLLLSACGRKAPARKEIFSRFLIPFGTVMFLCFLFMGYYNWRGTGNPFLLPYTLNDREYLSASPALLWEKSTPPHHYDNPQFEAFYNHSVVSSWEDGRVAGVSKTGRVFLNDLRTVMRFFVGPQLYVPFLAVLLVLRNRRIFFFVAQTAICFCCFLLVAWFSPHYAAPLIATMTALILEGLRYIRGWKFRNRPFGMALSRAFVLSSIVLTPFQPWGYQKVEVTNRARVAKQVAGEPGKQLLIVQYSPGHNSRAEWVYNRASIDDAKIVWAREIPGVSLSPLLNYFHGYHVWVIDPDSPSPVARPYNQPAGAN